MAKYAHIDVLDGGLNAIKNNAIRMLLLKAYVAADSYATVVANSICAVTVAGADFALSGADAAARVCTVAAKIGTASASSNATDPGTATGGSTTTLADTAKAWTVNAHAGRKVTITAGTGNGQVGRIASNTATVLTLSVAWAVAPDATSVYTIADDLHIAFTDNVSKVLLVTDETSDQAVTSGNTVNFPSLTYTSPQPV